MLNSAEPAQLSWARNKFYSFSIFILKANWNFMLNWVEHKKSFITSGPGWSVLFNIFGFYSLQTNKTYTELFHALHFD